jgi:hypothetical protein
MKKKRKLKSVMTHAVQSGTNGLTGLHALKHAVAVIKKDQSQMYAQISPIMSKLEPAALNFQTFHTLNGPHGANVLQLVPVV